MGRLRCKLDCTGCPMRDREEVEHKVPSFVYGKNVDSPDIFVVAEAPGRDENRDNEPMVGSAGDIMWRLLENSDLNKSVAIGNVCRCWPGKGNPDPPAAALKICAKHVKADIERLMPKIVVIAGKVAAQTLLNSKLGIRKLRGWHTLRLSETFKVDAFVINHPSALHYDPDIKSTIEAGLTRIRRRLQGEEENSVSYKLRYIDSPARMEKAIEHTLSLKGGVPLGFDWECEDLKIVGAVPLCLAWGWRTRGKDGKPTHLIYGVPLRHKKTPIPPNDYPALQKRISYLYRQLRKKHRKGEIQLTAHGAKFECAVHKDVLNVKMPQVFCSIQGAHAIDENRLKAGASGGGGKGGSGRAGIFSLEALAADWLGVTSEFWDKRTSNLLYSGQGQRTSPKACTDHCARDVAVQVALVHDIDQRAQAQDYDMSQLRPLLEQTPYLLGTIERNGMPADINMLAELKSDKGPLLQRQTEVLEELHQMPAVQKAISKVRGGSRVVPLFAKKGQRRGFNIRKRDYTSALFFDVLKIPWGATRDQQTKTGLPKIDKEFFGNYRAIPEVGKVEEWKQLDKLISTYIEGWWRLLAAQPDGRLRASFNAAGTTTGRLSCKDPNLQQIPRGKTKAAKILKKIFRPHCIPGSDDLRVIVACDLSQAEIRWLAEIADEPVLRDIYIKRAEILHEYSQNPSEKLAKRIKLECDLHRSTASEMFGIPLLEVTDNDRQASKAINFGNIYGQTDFGLAAQLGKEVEEARELLEKWLSRFQGARDWFEYTENFAKKHGFVVSPIGRRRHLDALLLGITSGSAEGHLLRVSRNAPIQSIASDMNVWIAIQVQKAIDQLKKPWLLEGMVHDSIIAEIPIGDVLEYVDVVQGIAEAPDLLADLGVPKMSVPQEMEFEVGFSYGEVKTLTNAPREREQVCDEIWDEWKQAA